MGEVNHRITIIIAIRIKMVNIFSNSPPVFMGPFILSFRGQRGWMPCFVIESRRMWERYPMRIAIAALKENMFIRSVSRIAKGIEW